MGHVHFVQPEDTAVVVDLANEILQRVTSSHPIRYIYLPVPKERTDTAYFAPLKGLKSGDTKLFLGVVHPNDEAGTKARLEAAKAAYSGSLGVATECGMERTPAEELDSILKIKAAI
jgi:hypothetical protein